MARGLMWLPLLAIFFGLAWAGWNEYSKLEAYKVWAAQFERAKYDIYAALGQKEDQLTWGIPTRQGVIDTKVLDLTEVDQLVIEVNNTAVDSNQVPEKGKFSLGFTLQEGRHLSIPFTDSDITRQWYDFICREWHL
ncbi:MAG: hypothetical protein ACFB16_01180 [Phormidesmis sp.]